LTASNKGRGRGRRGSNTVRKGTNPDEFFRADSGDNIRGEEGKRQGTSKNSRRRREREGEKRDLLRLALKGTRPVLGDSTAELLGKEKKKAESQDF